MTDIFVAMDQIVAAREAIFAHVGYAEGWQSSPIEDCRSMFWAVDEYEREWVKYALVRDAVAAAVAGATATADPYGTTLSKSLLCMRRLPKWIYRGAQLTLAVVEFGGGVLFQVFRNDHEVRVEHPLNQAIDSLLVADRVAATEGLRAKVRLLCARVAVQDLRSAIKEHRASCHQPDCPVLSAMTETLPEAVS